MFFENNILAFLEGTADAQTKERFENWINENPRNQLEYERAKEIWDNSLHLKDFKLFDVNQEWQVFQRNLVTDKGHKESAKVLRLERSRSIRNLISIAASLIILVTATWFLWPQSEFIDIPLADNDIELLLDDGSTVSIKKGASFRTLRSYKYAKERNVKIAGEVKFDIASDPSKPFIVETEETAVRVLGTIFNVIATGVESEVANEEGKVKFYVIEDESESVELNKGDRIKYDGTGFIDLNAPEPVEERVVPEVENILSYVHSIENVTFGSNINEYSHIALDVEYEGKNIYEIIAALETKAIVVYTTSCTGCVKIIEIIPFNR